MNPETYLHPLPDPQDVHQRLVVIRKRSKYIQQTVLTVEGHDAKMEFLPVEPRMKEDGIHNRSRIRPRFPGILFSASHRRIGRRKIRFRPSQGRTELTALRVRFFPGGHPGRFAVDEGEEHGAEHQHKRQRDDADRRGKHTDRPGKDGFDHRIRKDSQHQ
jgi:hypothetical protein